MKYKQKLRLMGLINDLSLSVYIALKSDKHKIMKNYYAVKLPIYENQLNRLINIYLKNYK